MSVIAIVPARGGSKGVPGKNLKPLGGFPLLAYSIAAARITRSIHRVIVSTDSPEIAEAARRFGAEVPFLRPARLAADAAPDIGFMSHAFAWLQIHENALPELAVHLRPTTPLRDPVVLERAFRVMARYRKATSLRSAHPAPESPFKWFRKDASGYFKGLPGARSNDTLNKPRQSFPQVYVPDGYIDIVRPSYVMKSGLLHGPRMAGFVSTPCCEVDTAWDFEYLEFELSRKGSVLADWLRREFGS